MCARRGTPYGLRPGRVLASRSASSVRELSGDINIFYYRSFKSRGPLYSVHIELSSQPQAPMNEGSSEKDKGRELLFLLPTTSVSGFTRDRVARGRAACARAFSLSISLLSINYYCTEIPLALPSTHTVPRVNTRIKPVLLVASRACPERRHSALV